MSTDVAHLEDPLNHTSSSSPPPPPHDDQQTVAVLPHDGPSTNTMMQALLSLSKSHEKLLKQHAQLLEKINQDQQQLNGKLDKVHAELCRVRRITNNKSGSTTTTEDERIIFKCREALPVNTYADLLAFEETMDVDDLREFFLYLGGRTITNMMGQCMSAVYTIELQANVTWRGIKRSATNRSGGGGFGEWAKPPLSVTKIPAIIEDACHATFPRLTRDDIMTAFHKFLMHSTDRLRKSIVQQQSTTPSIKKRSRPTEDDDDYLPY